MGGENVQRKSKVVASVTIWLMVPFSSFAHHSVAEYDRAKMMTMQATIVEFRYTSPHPQLFVDGPDANGNDTHWNVEIGPNPAELSRIGWGKERSERALSPGAVITLTIAPSKLNPVHAIAQRIVLAGGEQIFEAPIPLRN